MMVNWIIDLERKQSSNAQYTRREILEKCPVLHSIHNVDREEKVCKALSLTGTKVKPEDLDHRMKMRAR